MRGAIVQGVKEWVIGIVHIYRILVVVLKNTTVVFLKLTIKTNCKDAERIFTSVEKDLIK